MSTITREFTKEQLQQIIETDHVQCGEASSLARIALASLEAEPVEWRVAFTLDGQSGSDFEKTFESQAKMNEVISLHEHAGFSASITPLFTTPPVPVSVPADADDNFYSWFCREWEQNYQPNGYSLSAKKHLGAIAESAWFACRAAMLQGAEQQNRQQNIPENIPANTPCKQAPEHIWLQTAGVWPENGEFSELTWCSDNQHEDDTLYVRADVVSGNSQVIPDGLNIRAVAALREAVRNQWLKSDELADKVYWRSMHDIANEIVSAMLAAAPQQEVK